MYTLEIKVNLGYYSSGVNIIIILLYLSFIYLLILSFLPFFPPPLSLLPSLFLTLSFFLLLMWVHAYDTVCMEVRGQVSYFLHHVGLAD